VLPHGDPIAAAIHPCQQIPEAALTCHLIHLPASPEFWHMMLQTDDHPLKKAIKGVAIAYTKKTGFATVKSTVFL
jgi:hypothetical protein